MKFITHNRSIFIRLLFVVAIFFLISNVADNRKTNNEYLIRKIENDVYGEYSRVVPGFRKIKDSLDQIRNWRVAKLTSAGSGISTAFFGTSEINECDSCNSFDQTKFPGAFKEKYFIRLNGYTLKNDASFYIRNGKYFIETTIWDTIYENGAIGHPEEREIRVRYATSSSGTKNGAILIPVSKATYNIFNIATWVFGIALVIMFVWLMVLAVKVLYSIATGKPFTRSNIKRLNIIGIVFIAPSIIIPVFSVLIEWLLRNKIPPEIYYPFFHSIMDHRLFLYAGLIVLLIAYAFKKGYELQEEEDLTV